MPLDLSSGMSTDVYNVMIGSLTNFKGAGIMVFKAVVPIALAVLITIAVGTFMIHFFLRITGVDKFLENREIEQKAHEEFEEDMEEMRVEERERELMDEYYRGT